MGSETFIDTSGFYALLVERDEMHRRAAGSLEQARLREALTKDEHFEKAGFSPLLMP